VADPPGRPPGVSYSSQSSHTRGARWKICFWQYLQYRLTSVGLAAGLGGGALVLVHWLRRHRHLPPTGNRFPQALQTLWRWMASSMIDPCRSHQLNANAATLRRRHRPPALNMAQHRRTPWADSSFQVIAWFVCARFVCAPCALSRSDMGGSSTGPMRTRGLAASSGHPSGPRRAVWPA